MKQTIRQIVFMVFGIMVSVVMNAQVTTSSINGRVTDEKGEVLAGAAVIAVHTPSGTQYWAITNTEGRYAIQGMRAGGPYNVEISLLGCQTVRYTDITLQLAESTTRDAVLKTATEQLDEVLIVATTSKFATEKTGAVTNISGKQMTNLPTVSRSITDITKLSPYGGNGMSFAGSDGRTANFTVDGANFNNNFGLSSNLPGGGNPISIDAIEEVQVVISPFDVRQTNFIGGGVNAVTKSGTNTFKGSAYAYHRNENMRGNSVNGSEISGARQTDRTTTYGATLGGPIIKNKLFFFANFEYSLSPTVVNRWRPSTNGVEDADNYISRTTVADMEKVSNFLKEKYGYDPGSYTDYPADQNNMKILARLDWNINKNHKLALRYNYTNNTVWNPTNASSSDCGTRAVYGRLSQYSMSFANSLYSMNNLVHSASLDLNSRLSDKLSNQLLVTFSKLDDVRGTKSDPFPFIDILNGQVGKYIPYMSAGYELFTWNNAVHNTVITAKDDIIYYTGNHKITAGLSYEYQMADNAYQRNGTGYYRYNSLQDFLNGAAPETVAITYGYAGEMNPAARVRSHKLGIYAQDDWSATDNLKLSYGLRIDGLFFDNSDLMTNNAVLALDYNGRSIDTGKWPTSKLTFSPRIGFTWDVNGDQSLKVRGGTGLFSGRLPLVFFTNMPTNSNMVQNKAVITTGKKVNGVQGAELLKQFEGKMITNIPDLIAKFNSIDPKAFPIDINSDAGAKPSTIQAVDPTFKMPQVWKTSIAVDYAFATSFPMSVSVEGIFNKTINGVCLSNWDVMPVDGFTRLNGPDNRPLYPANYNYTGTDAFVLTNTNRGYGYSGNIMFRMSPTKNIDFTASYTHLVSKELTGMPGSDASSAFTYIPTVDGPNNAPLHNSQYVTPDRAFASLTLNDNSNNHFSFFYEAWRGGYNYTYMTDGDMNGDGYNYDVIYIPADKDEIRFVSASDRDRFWDFLEKDSYLSKNKGKYAEAYSVYSPWTHRVDFRYSHDFKVRVGNSVNTLQINFDIKNVLNLFNSSWGVSKYMNPNLNSGRIIAVDHIDGEGYPVYSTSSAVSGNTQTWTYYNAIGQCWYAQIGIKYMFN
ncbi:MAG: TonB-dependent receptor [Bacteroidales bacterium]|nr:TonB-dependent receptor [Bacteroidales bacterium]MDD4669443.1 TonB-dependent receptor [Bacteroidales bacterium]